MFLDISHEETTSPFHLLFSSPFRLERLSFVILTSPSFNASIEINLTMFLLKTSAAFMIFLESYISVLKLFSVFHAMKTWDFIFFLNSTQILQILTSSSGPLHHCHNSLDPHPFWGVNFLWVDRVLRSLKYFSEDSYRHPVAQNFWAYQTGYLASFSFLPRCKKILSLRRHWHSGDTFDNVIFCLRLKHVQVCFYQSRVQNSVLHEERTNRQDFKEYIL